MKLTQRNWRIAGALAITGAAGMAVFGAGMSLRALPIWSLAVYWGVFLLLLLFALYMALLDIRFIRLQYLLGRREIFTDTLGDEQFRAEIRQKMDTNRKQ